MKTKRPIIIDKVYTVKSVEYNGALIAVAAAFAYSMVVMMYSIVRSSITIFTIMPVGERKSILLANGCSIAYSSIFFSLLTAAISSIPGFFAAAILKKLLLYFNPEFNKSRTILISSIVGLAMPLCGFILLHALLKERMTFDYPETFLFWFLFPAIIFFTVSVIGGHKLSIGLKS